MPFLDRSEATNRLAERLSPYRGQHPLVLAIPRGAAFNPEFELGAVDESG